MRRNRLAGALVVLLFAVASCGAPPTPTPSPTPSPTPTPTPVPRLTIGFDATSADLIAQIPSDEVACIRESLGAAYAAFAATPLTDAAGLLASAEVVPCLSADTLAALVVAGLDAQTGGISDESAACIVSIVATFGSGAASLGESQGASLGSMVSLLLCLTEEEASKVFVDLPGTDGAVSLADVRCLSEQADTADMVAAFGRAPDEPLPAVIVDALRVCGVEVTS